MSFVTVQIKASVRKRGSSYDQSSRERDQRLGPKDGTSGCAAGGSKEGTCCVRGSGFFTTVDTAADAVLPQHHRRLHGTFWYLPYPSILSYSIGFHSYSPTLARPLSSHVYKQDVWRTYSSFDFTSVSPIQLVSLLSLIS
jgi:hypothetical protein